MDLLYKRDKTDEDVAKLLRMHKNLVYYCLAQTQQIYNHDAESAAFEALWDAINLFDVYATTAFSTFACKVIINRIYTVLRDAKTHNKREILVENSAKFIDCYEQDSEIQDKRYIRLCNQIEQYISEQTDKIRAILIYWRARNYKATTVDIAQHCGVSASYVSRVQVSFRVAIQAMLKENREFDKD